MHSILSRILYFILVSALLAGCSGWTALDSTNPPTLSEVQTESTTTAVGDDLPPQAATAAGTPPLSSPRPIEVPTPTASARLAGDQDDIATRIPLIAARNARFAAALRQDPPVLRRPTDALTSTQQRAQELALANPSFVQYAYSLADGTPLRSEVFNIFPARAADMSDATAAACADDTCYRVELYNYGVNVTTVAIVALDRETVVDVLFLNNSQPELTPELTELALQIALAAPEVEAELGFQPQDATMPNVKTALNDSPCEQSSHLCVAPTFLVGERALWAVVDLTDQRLVGVRWTDLGTFNGDVTSERVVIIESLLTRYCEQRVELADGDWSLAYTLTTSDGLEVTDVRYQGELVMRSAKLVDWHVSYSREDAFGYSDSVGCPYLATYTTVIANSAPEVVPIEENGNTVGFALTQDFSHRLWPMPCNYRYEQRYEFFADGRFRVVAGNLGRGCGNDGTYRPILRLDLNGDLSTQFSAWDGVSWQPWAHEQWAEQTRETQFTPEGYLYRLQSPDGRGFFIEPGHGQFWDGGRGDFAYVYLTEYQPDEGDADMVSLGSCCNSNHEQGPEAFIDAPPADLTGREVILWYVPQLENDDAPGSEYCWAEQIVRDGLFDSVAWPCYAGPMFVPIPQSAP